MIITDNEFIDIPTPAGPMRTYVLYPVAEGRYPGIVLFSEIFQVTGPIRLTAALLAGHGFVVVVPEILHELEEPGTVLPYDQAGADRGNADKINKELSSYDADAKAALSYLKSYPKCTGKIGSMGFCIGGHLAFRSATNPEVLAATCCYPTDIHKRSLGKGLNDDTLVYAMALDLFRRKLKRRRPLANSRIHRDPPLGAPRVAPRSCLGYVSGDDNSVHVLRTTLPAPAALFVPTRTKNFCANLICHFSQ
jgi:dienelactone hydrolase